MGSSDVSRTRFPLGGSDGSAEDRSTAGHACPCPATAPPAGQLLHYQPERRAVPLNLHSLTAFILKGNILSVFTTLNIILASLIFCTWQVSQQGAVLHSNTPQKPGNSSFSLDLKTNETEGHYNINKSQSSSFWWISSGWKWWREWCWSILQRFCLLQQNKHVFNWSFLSCHMMPLLLIDWSSPPAAAPPLAGCWSRCPPWRLIGQRPGSKEHLSDRINFSEKNLTASSSFKNDITSCFRNLVLVRFNN